LENAHLKAIAKTSAGVESVVTLTNHTGAGNVNGGTVRTAVAVPTTSTLTIYRDVPITQTTTYAEGGDFPAASHERALDKLTQISQQNARKLGSALRLSEANQIGELNPPLTNQQHILSSVGGAAPSWQALPSLSIGPVIATGSTTARSVQDRFADFANVKDFGAVGDGVTDDTSAIQAALNSTATSVYFPSGSYRVANNGTTGDPAISSSVANRRIFGEGIITATSQVKRALGITGNNTTVTLHFDGNLNIGTAIYVAADNPVITGCRISNLDGKTTWQGVGVHLAFDGRDTSALVSNNVIKNLQGAGDGVGGNGVGMQRAVLVETDQNCNNAVFITGNNIDTVQGEEGDAIVVAGGTSASPLTLPCVIANNVVKSWNRRAVKIAANGVTVANNYFTNNLPSSLPTLQRVIDATSGSNLLFSGNTFDRCLYHAQIAVFLDSPQIGNNIKVVGNTISGIGATVASSLMTVRSYGTGITFQNNCVIAEGHTGASVDIRDSADVVVAGNTIISASTTPITFTSCTNTRMVGNVTNTDTRYIQYHDEVAGEWVTRINNATATRAFVLHNADTSLSDGEIAASVACRQNDASTPNTISSSVKFVAEGSSGALAVTLCSGGGATADIERLRVKSNGNVGIGVNPTSKLHVDGDLTLANATTATAATAGAETLPANPVGFLLLSLNGASRKIPYYAT
jgi:hypothetical protein